VQRLRGRLVFKAHRHLYHSTLGSRIVRKKEGSKAAPGCAPCCGSSGRGWGTPARRRRWGSAPCRASSRGRACPAILMVTTLARPVSCPIMYQDLLRSCPIMYQDIVHRVQISTDTSGLVPQVHVEVPQVHVEVMHVLQGYLALRNSTPLRPYSRSMPRVLCRP